MNKFLVSVLLLALAPLGSLAAVPPAAQTEDALNNSATAGPSVRLGTQVTQNKIQVAKCVYDYAVLGGGSTATPLTLKDVDGGSCAIPANAVIVGGFTDTVTNPTATVYTGSTLALSSGVGASDLKAGQLFSNYHKTIGNARVALIPTGTTATMIKTAAIVNPTLTVNGVLTAGKINVFIEYLLSN